MNNNSSILPQKSSHTGSPACCTDHDCNHGSASTAHSPDVSIHTSRSAVARALDAAPGKGLGPGAGNGDAGGALLGRATKTYSALINQAVSEALDLRFGPPDWIEGAEIERYDPKTGEIKTFQVLAGGAEAKEKRKKKDKDAARDERWRLLDIAQGILQAIDHRTCGCMHHVLGGDPTVLQTQYGCHYGNLMVCGSVWTCPPCATRISERRREEIDLAVERHIKEAGGQIFMITLTFPHGAEDDLKKMLKRLRKALNKFKGSRRMGKLKRFLEVVGTIRALEVTWGLLNGWHPHVHEIWLLGPEFNEEDLEGLQEELLLLWRRACKNSGFSQPDAYHGVDISMGEDLAGYIAKWGMGAELTKANIKQSKEGRYTPWDLLRWHGETGDEKPAELFREYAQAFHGAHQLVWSHGLKKHYRIGKYSNQELAEKQEEQAVIVIRIPREDWSRVCQDRGRGMVLVLAENGGAPAVLRYLESLRARKSMYCQPLGQSPP